jgi:tripartite-type tricarboxylate transporter receptor subunit TctC
MRSILHHATALAVMGCTVLPSFSHAQTYPNRPVRIVISPAGGGNDFAARLIATGLSAPLGQQVIVDNRAGGVVPGDVAARSKSDGYTLLVAGGTFIARLNQHIVRVITSPDVKQKFFDAGVEVVASTPEQFARRIRTEIDFWAKIIKAGGIKVD